MSIGNYILQTASIVLFYLVGCTGSLHILGSVTLYLLFFYTPFWPLVLLYLSWTHLVDWKTPKRGGRDLMGYYAKRLSVFKYMRDYFPVSLIKTSDLDPEKKYIFGFHPHGIVPDGAIIALGTEACGFSEKFPGIFAHLSGHSGILRAWIYRDIAMSLGMIDVSRDSLEYVLTQKGTGHSVVIFVGGQVEIFDVRQDLYLLTLKKRKGFIKLALETGCDLVPVFAFGQTNLYHITDGEGSTVFARFLRWLKSKTGCRFCCCWGACWLPKRSPINVVVGSPIAVKLSSNPSQEEIDHLHSKYTEELTQLYERNKDKYHPTGSSKLVIK